MEDGRPDTSGMIVMTLPGSMGPFMAKVFKVIAASACPSISERDLTSTPRSMHRVAKVCLRA